jgi:hypothetical protein
MRLLQLESSGDFSLTGYYTRFPAHVHHPAKCTSTPPNLFLTTPYFKNQLLNNHTINLLVIKNRDRLIVNKQYYKLVLALLEYLS